MLGAIIGDIAGSIYEVNEMSDGLPVVPPTNEKIKYYLEFTSLNATDNVCERNGKADIIMQETAFGNFWHKSQGTDRYIGLDSGIKELEQVKTVDGSYCFNENMELFTCEIADKRELIFWPKGNLVLKQKINEEYIQDDFMHEQYLVLKENDKMILISGCAHNGILNILRIFSEKYKRKPDAIISGFHMKNKTGYSEEDIALIEETARQLKEMGIECYTGHCTGEEPYGIMKKIMRDKLHYIHCGDRIDI